jgi:hypothetical protein
MNQIIFYSCLASCKGCTVRNLVITALSLQALLFYGEGPAAIKLVDNRSPFQSRELLHALAVESRYPRRILLVLFKWVRRESCETSLSVTHLDLPESVLSTAEKIFSEIV